jgi:CrcB protein
MKTILAIAIGGALGAVGRHFVAHQVNQLFSGGFPFGTLGVNILGSFLLGVLIEVMALFWSPSPELRALLTVGFLGAFTTFSTFSMEVVLLFERGAHAQMALYVALSVALSITGLFAGLAVVRAVGP